MPVGATITIPRREREGSITDAELLAVHQAVMGLENVKRGAVVVAEGKESENSARNKARNFALLHEEEYATIPDPDWTPGEGQSEEDRPNITNPRRYLTAHALPDPEREGKFIGVVSIRSPQVSKVPQANTASGENAETTTAPDQVQDGGGANTAGNEGNAAKAAPKPAAKTKPAPRS